MPIDNSIWYAVCGFCLVVGFLAGVAFCQWGLIGPLVVMAGAGLLLDGLRFVVRSTEK